MSLFRRNIIEQTFPSAKVVVTQDYYGGRIVLAMPTDVKRIVGGVYSISTSGFVFGKSLGTYDYWCLHIVRVSAVVDYFRIITLCPTIINGVYHNTGYTWTVGDGSTTTVVWEGFIIALDKSYTNYNR